MKLVGLEPDYTDNQYQLRSHRYFKLKFYFLILENEIKSSTRGQDEPRVSKSLSAADEAIND